MVKKIWSITSNIIGGLLFIAICFLVFIVFSSRLSGDDPTILGYQMKVVLSGSMEPTFQTGSIISIRVSNDPSSYQKGDNNNGPDLWTVSAQDIVGKYTGFTIPYVGYALNYANTKAGIALLLIVPGIWLVITAFRRKESEVREAL